MPLTGSVTLHGVAKAIAFDALVVKHDVKTFSVSARKPILINSTDFEMNAGIEALRAVVGILSVGEKVPVYFKMYLTKDNPTAVAPIAMAPAPTAPTGLAANLSQVTSVAYLNWADTSANETGFIVRRKGADGRWVTATSTLANLASASDTLVADGLYSYKVFAYKDSIPSLVSNIAEVTRGVPATSSSVGSVVATSSSSVVSKSSSSAVSSVATIDGAKLFTTMCAGCHVPPSASFPKQRDWASLSAYIHFNMPYGNVGACDTNCGDALATYMLGGKPSSSSIGSTSSVSSRVSSSVASVACPTTGPTYGPRTLRLLTKNEYMNSIRDLTGVDIAVNLGQTTVDTIPADNQLNSFSNNTMATLDSTALKAYDSVAKKVIDLLVTRTFTGVVNCANMTADQCSASMMDNIGLKVMRRPVTAAERTTYLPLVSTAITGGDINEGIKITLRTLLTSPQFLYRNETGTLASQAPVPGVTLAADAYVLSSYELASFLSYTFAGTTPDAALLAAAASNSLSTTAQVSAQVTRLLNGAQAHRHFGDFAAQWLHTDKVLDMIKDPVLYPTFTPDVRKAMAQEVRDIYTHVVLDQGAPFTQLYDGNFAFVNQALANFYGIAGVTGTAMQKVPTTARTGLITSGAFMTAYAHEQETAPILRSVYTRRVFMCHYVAPPPTGVALDGTDVDAAREAARVQWEAYLAANGGKATSRKKYEFLTSATLCASCHAKMINPLGGGMEDFSAVGLPITKDYNQLPIDASGVLYGVTATDDGQTLTFNGAKELAHGIAGLDVTRQCFIDNNFRLAMGTGASYLDRDKAISLSASEKANYACEVNKLDTVMKGSNNSTRAMLQALGSMDSVRYRKNVTR